MAEKNKSLRDLVYFPFVFNVVAILVVSALFVIAPQHMVEADVLNVVLYVVVFITEWSLFYIIVKRLGSNGVRELIVPKRKSRLWPSVVVFVSLNLLFTTYMLLALIYGRIPPLGSVNSLQIVFFVVLNPITAGFVEELIWRGYFIEKLLSTGKTDWKAVVYSSISFAFIHGFFMFDKLIVTFLFGIIAGIHYIRERNLPILMVSHTVVDVLAFGLWAFRQF